MSKNPGKYIALTGINATDNPGPGVPIARSLKESSPNLPLIGLSYDPHDPGNYMDFLFNSTYSLPYPTQGWDRLLQSVLEVRKKHEIQLLIPSLDVELPLFIQNAPQLKSLGIETFLPTAEQFNLRSKDTLAKMGSSLGLRYPKTIVVNSIEELTSTIETEISLPCVVKGKYYKAYIVYNVSQAVLKFTEISDEWGFPILLQEVVTGTEVNLIGLGDGLGESCGMVAIKKLRTTHLGKIWSGVTLHAPELMDLGQRFIQRTKWRGPFELECIQSSDGLYLIEVNPRFPAWVYFATAIGINLPQRLVDLVLTGQCNRKSDFPSGKFFVRYTYEIVTDLENFHRLSVQP